jgi:hypothetical protein
LSKTFGRLLLFFDPSTITHHCCLFVLFLSAAMHMSMPQVSYVSWLLLCVAASLAAWSLAIYFANVWTHFVAPPQPQPEKKAA